MTLAQRTERVFGIDNEICLICDGAVLLIACIEVSLVVEQITSC